MRGLCLFGVATLVLSVSAQADTVYVPPVVISELYHEYSYDQFEDRTAVRDMVTFPSGPGVFSGPGFTETIGQGDRIVIRFEAPEGYKFVVTEDPSASYQQLRTDAYWHTGAGDSSSHWETPTVTYENLVGPLPATTYRLDYVGDAGEVVKVVEYADVQDTFEFTALQIEFTATAPLESLERTYGPVNSTSAPSFGSMVEAPGVIPDQTIMAIVQISSEPDATPPAAVTDLATNTPTTSSITLTWTASGDDESGGTAAEYDVRYSTSTVTEDNWGSAQQASGEPTPQVAGTAETFTVPGLQANTTYYFALKIRDEVPNWSTLSNVPTGMTSGDATVVVNLHPPGGTWGSDAYGVQGGQQVGRAQVASPWRASLWSGSAASWVNLHPTETSQSQSVAYGVYGGQQVGYAYSHWWGAPEYRASLWTGTAASWVDLSPAGATYSVAYGVYDGQQVGEADVDGFTQASLWTGTAASWVSLHPAVAEWSEAAAVYGGQQVGRAYVDSLTRASLWTGTAESWVDLSPAGATGSSCHGVHGGRQVGDAWVDGIERASLWTGTAESWVDLHPAGATASMASGVYDGRQVGTAIVDGVPHASMWTGSAASWVDLAASSGVGYSYASGVWDDGTFTYVVGSRYELLIGRTVAVMWVVPDNATGACCSLGGTCETLTWAQCADQGGQMYMGNGTVCNPNPCPQPTGACCSSDGVCSIQMETVCVQAGGTWAGIGTTCGPEQCVVLPPGGSPSYPDIQAAVSAMPNNSVLLLGAGTFSGFGNYEIDPGTKTITIRGDPGGGTIIDCGGDSHRAFIFNGSGACVVEEVTLVNCESPSGVRASGYGGAISCMDSSPTFNGVTIIGGTAQVGGGGIYCSGGAPVITNCTIVGCSAPQGGGIYLANGAQVTMSNTIIASSTQGEAIWCVDTSSAILTCSDLYGNAGGDWVGCVADQDGMRDNFSLDPLFCNPGIGTLTLRSDSPCAAHPVCGLVGSLGVGCTPAGVLGSESVPSAFRLYEAQPNPFTQKTTISYELSEASLVQLMIYDVSGRVVRTLVSETRPAGSFTVTWDGRDDRSRPVSRGIYFYAMKAGAYESQKRMTLLK